MHSMSLPSPTHVAVGLSVPIQQIAALDQLAERKGITRSAMIRAVIGQGLIASLQEEPDLLSQFEASPQVPIREKRRPRLYRYEPVSLEGGCNVSS